MTASRASIAYSLAKRQRANQLQAAEAARDARLRKTASDMALARPADRSRVTLPKLKFMESQNPAGGKIQATQGGVRAAAVMTGQSTVAAAPTNDERKTE